MSNNRPESHSARNSFSLTVANQKSSARLICVKLANNRVIGAVMGDESVKGIRNRELARFPRISLCSNKFSWFGPKKER
jgi:hypothetical protein